MRLIFTCLLFLMLFLVATASEAQAQRTITDSDQRAFDDIFKSKLAEAKRTRADSDDIAILEEMASLVSRIPDDPGVRCLIYIEAIPLAASVGELKQMKSFAGELKALWPEHKAGSLANQIALADRAYRQNIRTKRKEVADVYVTLLLEQAEKHESESDYKKGVEVSRQAISVARAGGSEKRSIAEDYFKRISDIYAHVRRVEYLTQSIERNPKNTPAARELVNLLITKREDIANAVKYAPLADDPELVKVLGICLAGADEASAADALRVADWYYELSEEEQGQYEIAMLKHASQWYKQFFEEHKLRDTLASRVRDASQVVQARLAEIEKQQYDALYTDWVNLFKENFDLDKHTIWKGKKLTPRNGGVSVDGGSFVFPVQPGSNYELRVNMTVARGTDEAAALLVYLPMGRKGAVFRYLSAGDKVAFLDGVSPGYVVEDRKPSFGKEVVFLFHVSSTEDGEYEIIVTIDGDRVIDWQGALDAFSLNNTNIIPPEDFGNIFQISSHAAVTFNKIELRVSK